MLFRKLNNNIQHHLRRLVKTMVSDLKKGDHILHNDRLLVVDMVNSVQKGRGARSFLISAREIAVWGPNAAVPSVTTIKPTGKDHFDVVSVKEAQATFLYRQGDQVAVMSADMDEVFLPASMFTDALMALVESGERIRLKRVASEDDGDHQERIVAAVTGPSIKCTVKQVNQQGSNVVVVTQSGGRVNCPPIVAVGDTINVDATTGQYLGRA